MVTGFVKAALQKLSGKLTSLELDNPFQPSVAFCIETSDLFCFAKQMTGFYMKRSTGLEWIKEMTNI